MKKKFRLIVYKNKTTKEFNDWVKEKSKDKNFDKFFAKYFYFKETGKPFLEYCDFRVIDESFFKTIENLNIFYKIYCQNNQYSVMVSEFTGLKDINGKNIYAGDIVKSGGKVGIIKYDQNICIFSVEWEGDDTGYFLEAMKNPKFEVIGNEIENPKLFNAKKNTQK